MKEFGITDLARAVFVILLSEQGWEQFPPTFTGQQYCFICTHHPRISLCSSFLQYSYHPNKGKIMRG